MSRFFIDRPVFAAVLSIVIVIVGVVAVVKLPVAQYPEVAPPTISITANYPGANALDVAENVATPIEQEVNGVEFAKQKQDEGLDRFNAAVEASKLRLRPILMTSFAFILGVVPLVLATGAGAEMRTALGIAVFSGMLGVTVFGIFLTPVFYFVMRWLVEPNGPAQPSKAIGSAESKDGSASAAGKTPVDDRAASGH
jgi:multidrug efflux pump subunit AcrB